MGSYAYLETDNGQSLSIRNEFRVNQGTPLMAFLAIYQGVLARKENSPELDWFTRLEEQSTINLRVLTKIIYGEDMRYSPDEYDRFMAEWGSIYESMAGMISEEEFKQKLEEVEQMWTPIDDLIPVVEEMLHLLPKMGDDTHWYAAENTPPAFQSLLNTLMQAKNNGGEKARIFFS